MENQYVYTKKRSDFGRQCLFSSDTPKIIDNLVPNRALMEDYILRDPVHRGMQCSKVFAEHELNTIRAEYDQHSMNHSEGGWPKDVNHADIEQTMRFRKKVEKDEMYIHTVLQLSHMAHVDVKHLQQLHSRTTFDEGYKKPMEHCIFQNNAVNFYELYFTDEDQSSLVERSSSRTVNVFRDPSVNKRPVQHLSWSPDGGSRLAVTHCNLDFQRAPPDLSTHSYIWEVENPNKPELVLQPAVPIVCLEYNPKDPHSLVSGLYNGQVAFWDTRRGSDPVELSSLAYSHRDPTHCVLWINSKSGTEFFSASTDGQVKWWDVRKLMEPMETLMLDVTKGEEQVLSRAMGASCLEYEPTIPTRFMVGTENGIVISGNRKGKTPAEKLGAQFKTHYGPVYALQRNPAFVKNFLTVGDWTVRIWSEDCKESSIIWTSFHRAFLSSGSWSPTRYSVFYTTRVDGTLDVWDILQNQREACLSVKVCDEALRCLRCHEYGELVAVGNDRGTAYLVEFSENLAVAAKNDKALLTAMFERESRREKIIEGKMREIRLRVRTRQSEAHSATSRDTRPTVLAMSAADNLLRTAETDFFTIIDEEEKKAMLLEGTEETAEGEEDGNKPPTTDTEQPPPPPAPAPAPPN